MEELEFKKKAKIEREDALIIVDIQNDFIPGGSLAVDEGNLIIDGINQTADMFKKSGAIVVMTQDWHPKNHKSFASSHPGKSPGDEFTSDNGAIGPVLWPDHCVQGTKGAEFHKDLQVNLADKIIRKGMNPYVDSYSGFQDNDKKTETGLREYLISQKIKRIFICGLALDYCCYYTATDGFDFEFVVFFLVDLSRGVDLPAGNVKKALMSMSEKGIIFVKHDSLS
jgi:nicotinamidase/pyrazinamidase